MIHIAGKANRININKLCTKFYGCEVGEYEFGPDYMNSPSVIIRHSRRVIGSAFATITPDNMELIATLYPGINGGSTPIYDTIYKILFTERNIPEQAIDIKAFNSAYELLKNGFIVDSVVVARGVKEVDGKNGELQLFFEKPSGRPVSKDGKILLKELNKFVTVSERQLLARVTLPDDGSEGYDVYGHKIPQEKGQPVELNAGVGVFVKENEYYAGVDGYVEYENNTVSVTETLTINGNVDFSTGNIDFIGNVEIKGDIMPGFVVKGKNVTVDGVCQAAKIKATENIILHGTKGVNPGSVIKANGSIEVGYAENAKITTKKDIKIEKYAFNCDIKSGRMVIAGENTMVAGGSIESFEGGEFYNIGTEVNSNIIIKVGQMYDSEEKLAKIEGEKERLYNSLEKIEDSLNMFSITDYDNIKNPKLLKLKESHDTMSKRIQLFENKINHIVEESMFKNPVIIVRNRVVDGVMLQFFATKLLLKTAHEGKKYYFDPIKHAILYEKL